MTPIDKHEIRYCEGYFATVDRLAKDMPRKIAWELTEDALWEYWGLERYSTYKSFLSSYFRHRNQFKK